MKISTQYLQQLKAQLPNDPRKLLQSRPATQQRSDSLSQRLLDHPPLFLELIGELDEYFDDDDE